MGRCRVIVTIDNGLWHLSISTSSGNLPSYKEIKAARYKYCPGDITMGELFPPVEEFVNVAEVRHLWQIKYAENDKTLLS